MRSHGVGETLRIRRQAPPRSVAVLQPQRGHLAAVGANPAKGVRRSLGPDAAPQHRAVDAHAPEDLRQLRRVAELIRHVADTHRPAEQLGAPQPELQVANQRLAVGEQRVGLRVPGSDVQAALLDERADARLRRRSQLEVVVDERHLAVEREAEPLVTLELVERLVEHLDQVRAEDLEGLVPLAIPMGVCNERNSRGRHAPYNAPPFATGQPPT